MVTPQLGKRLLKKEMRGVPTMVSGKTKKINLDSDTEEELGGANKNH